MDNSMKKILSDEQRNWKLPLFQQKFPVLLVLFCFTIFLVLGPEHL